MNNHHRILLVEDNLTTSKTLKLFLNAEGYDVVPAFTGRQALDQFDEQGFDLVMLDLMLPDIDGLTVCETIRKRSPVSIIILTARSTEDEIVDGLERGADDYVCKPFGARELLARVRRCLRQSREPSHQPIVLTNNEIQVDTRKRSVTVGGIPVKLTKTEFEILVVLMRQPGRVFTRDQLIARTLGRGFDGYDRTIDTHIWSLRKKLGEPKGNPRYILSEPGVGYRMSDQHAK